MSYWIFHLPRLPIMRPYYTTRIFTVPNEHTDGTGLSAEEAHAIAKAFAKLHKCSIQVEFQADAVVTPMDLVEP